MDMSADPIHNRRLRLLMPRPFPTTATNYYSLHNPNIPSSIPPLGKREGIGGQPLASTRWNPTAEQVQALEEMYRRGLRTPSGEEIHQITAQLRRFGRIEGKNVFYWFQNHKARDRQRKRRQLVGVFAGESDRSAQIPPRKRSGSSKRHSENEHPKKLPTMSNCSTSSKNYESMYGGEVQELQHKITNEDKIPSKENTYYSFVPMCKQLTPKSDYFRSGIKENQTLQLFPVRTNDSDTVDEETNDDGSSLGLTRSSPIQFFVFLPTKN